MESIQPLLEKAANATNAVKQLSDDKKKQILLSLASEIRNHVSTIVSENKKDLDRMPDTDPKKDRLLLTPARIEDLAKSMEEIAYLTDPTNQVLSEKTLANGLFIQKKNSSIGCGGCNLRIKT